MLLLLLWVLFLLILLCWMSFFSPEIIKFLACFGFLPSYLLSLLCSFLLNSTIDLTLRAFVTTYILINHKFEFQPSPLTYFHSWSLDSQIPWMFLFWFFVFPSMSCSLPIFSVLVKSPICPKLKTENNPAFKNAVGKNRTIHHLLVLYL